MRRRWIGGIWIKGGELSRLVFRCINLVGDRMKEGIRVGKVDMETAALQVSPSLLPLASVVELSNTWRSV